MVRNIALLFLSGKLFPPFFLIAGIVVLWMSRSKRFYDSLVANNCIEHANHSIKNLKIHGRLMIALAVVGGARKEPIPAAPVLFWS